MKSNIQSDTTTKDFYDEISSQYTEAIKRCVPKYDEMLSNLFFYLPKDLTPKNILELGCGTGNLTSRIVHHFPTSRVVAVDVSGAIISECKKRLNNLSIDFIQEDITKLNISKSSYDLIMSSISIHHLTDKDKEKLFHKIFKWLAKGGIFIFSDQMRGETDEIYQKNMDTWKIHADKNGVSSEEWNTWMEHQEAHDFHSTVRSHLKWLEDAGFRELDCVWRYALWSIIYAENV